MRIAIVLHRDFPTGGLQRDARALASALVRRGHQVALISREAEGEPPAGVERRLVPSGGFSNHARDLAFAAAYRHALHAGERVIGLDKLPGLDLYFAADDCWKDRSGLLARLTPRGRAKLALESAVCAPEGPPIAVLTATQRASYRRAYDLPLERFLLLPPLRDSAYRPGPDLDRAAARQALTLPAKAPVALFVGRDAQLKGLDRVLASLAALGPGAPLLLCVAEPTARHRRQAGHLGGRVSLRSGGELTLCYAAADLLLHPARREAGGKVIAEALGHGLPVLCTAACGYAWLVAESGAGTVLPEPFHQEDLDALLARALWPSQLARWQARARLAAKTLLAEEGIERLADAVEALPARSADRPAPRRPAVQLAAGAASLLPAEAVDSLDWLFSLSGQSQRQQGERDTLAVTLRGQTQYLKRHGGAGWAELVKNWLTLKPPVLGAGQEWQALHTLGALGIAAPQPLVFAERGRNPARRRSALLMAALPPGEAIEDRVQRAPSLTAAERHALLRQVALTVRRLHDGGVAHRDLYICHVFRLHDGRIALLDLHRALLHRPLASRWLAKDLAALAFSSLPYGLSRRDRLRFLVAYHGLPLRLAARRFGGLWWEVERRVARLQTRAARRLSG